MFVHNLWQGVLRRWYFALACLVASLSFAGYVYVTTPPTYEASASVVLVPPVEQVSVGGNPFLFMGGLDQALAVLTVRVGSPAVAEPILKKDPGLTYTVVRDTGTVGPIIRITAEGNTGEVTLRILNEVVKTMPVSMNFLQDELKVDKKSRINVMTIVEDKDAIPVNKKQQRLVLTVVGSGLLFTVLATAALDRVLTSRKSKKAKRTKVKPRNGGNEANAAQPVNLAAPGNTTLVEVSSLEGSLQSADIIQRRESSPALSEEHDSVLMQTSFKD